jgi:endonuclease/exonuclease/phosphatase family metal-dependent hydrolase
MQRLALEATLETTLETPLGLVQLTTAHLAYYSAVQRAAQVERLRELHREAVAQARCAARRRVRWPVLLELA